MALTLSEKVLAGYRDQKEVRAGQLIEARLDFVMGNDQKMRKQRNKEVKQ
ncbi:MAG: hypothetical protein AB1641_03010 [Thermodesulfobacteriota bacterium]